MSALVPLTPLEPFFRSPPLNLAKGITVTLELLSTGEAPAIFKDEAGTEEFTGTITTDTLGRVRDGGEILWVEVGTYRVKYLGTEYIWEAAKGDVAAEIADISAHVAVVKEAPLNVEYPEYGADGTRATDSIAAFEKAIAALPVAGGEIFCPRLYKLSGQLNLEGKRRVVFVGQAGVGTGNDSCSQILFTQGSSAALINQRKCRGVVFRDLQIEYTNSSQTGAVMDCRESFKPIMERVQLVGAGGVNSALGIDLDKAECGSFRDMQIGGMDVGAKGKATDESFSNIMVFENVIFTNNKTAHMKNAGESWKIGAIFEPLVSGDAGGYMSDAGVRAYGTVFDVSWAGDVLSSTGTQILWRGKGLVILSGSIGSGALGISVPDATSQSVVVLGARFGSLTDGIRLAAGVTNYVIGANSYESSVTGKKVSLDGGATDAGEGFLAS